jgi:hypothetical protein
MKLSKIQLSQLYISKQKLAKVNDKFNPQDFSTLGLIPIKKLWNAIFYTDGHTRAFAAYQAGLTKIPVIWEDTELDWELYKICIQWCRDEGLFTIADLSKRVINHKNYEIWWNKRCENLQNKLNFDRSQKDQHAP